MGDDGRPGWWMASDGQWYPPDQHPDPEHRARYPAAAPGSSTDPTGPAGPTAPLAPVPAAPAPGSPVAPSAPVAPQAIEPKARPQGTGRVIGVVAAAALVVAAGVGAFLLSGGGDDDDEAADRTTTTEGRGDEDADADADEDGDGDETTTTAAEPVEPPFDAVTVEVDDPLPFTFEVPEGFIVVQTSPTPQTGAELAPDDADLAAAIDRIVAGLPGSAVLAIDPDFEPTSEQPPTIIAVAVQTPEDGVDAAGQAERNLADYQAGGVATEGEVTEGDDGTAVLRFTASGGSVNHQVFRALGSSVVVFAAIGPDAEVFAPITDAVAATLVAG